MSLNLKANTLASGIADPIFPLDARLGAVNLLRASEATVSASADEAGGEKENAYAEGFTFDFWRTGGSGTHWLRASFSKAFNTGETLDTTGEGLSVLGISISADGLHLYTVDNGTDLVTHYALAIPFDLRSAVADGASLNVLSETTNSRGVAISSDGKHLYVGATSPSTIFAYTMSVPFDLNTAGYDGAGSDLDVSGEDTNLTGVTISSDGLHIYASGATNKKVYAYTMTVAFDLASAGYDGAGTDLDVSTEDAAPVDLGIDSSGTILVVLGNTSKKAFFYALGTAHAMGTANYNGVGTDLDVSGEDAADPEGLAISPDGAKLYMAGRTDDKVYAYTAAVPMNYMGIAAHDLHNHGATVKAQFGRALSMNVNAQDNNPRDCVISSDGLHLYVIGDTGNKVYAFTLAVAHDLFTAVHDTGDDLDISGQDISPRGLTISSDGLRLYIVGITAAASVYQYDLSVAFDLGSAVYSATDDLDVSGQDTAPQGVSISSDGLHLYVIGATNQKAYAYTFGVAYDGSSLTYDGAGDDLDISGQDTAPTGLSISSDGLHLYFSGNTNNKAYAFTLAVAHDLGTASYDGSGFDLDVSGQDTVPDGVSVSSDGFNLYVMGGVGDRVFAYSMTTAFDLSTAENITWLDASETFTPRTSGPILMLFDDVVALNHRLLLTVTTEPSIGAVHLGCALKFEAPLPGGYQPPSLSRADRHLPMVAEGGQFLGRSIISEGTTLDLQVTAIPMEWLRSRWEAHVRLLEQFPFFFAAGDEPLIDGIAEGGAVYAWAAQQPRSGYDSRVYGSLSLRAEGIVT